MSDSELPPELARIRRFDEAMHRAAMKRAGFTGPQADKHVAKDLQERSPAEARDTRALDMPPARDASPRKAPKGKGRRKPRPG